MLRNSLNGLDPLSQADHNREMNDQKKVFVFRTAHLGDTVCAIPALRLIRQHFHGAELTLLCDEPAQSFKVAAADVIQGLQLFNNITTYRSRNRVGTLWELFRRVRSERPDLLLILPQARQSGSDVRRKRWFFKFCGVPDVRAVQLHHLPDGTRLNEAHRLVRIVNAMGIPGAKPPYEIPSDPATYSSVRDKLSHLGIEHGQPFIVFCGGGKDATQRWPLGRYAAVLARLADHTRCEIVAVGTTQELEAYRSEVLPVFSSLRFFTAELTIPEMFELCRSAVGYLGNDTGPMHVAAAVGCPVAVIMSGRAPPGSWYPDVDPRLVIRQQTECEGCFLGECLIEQHRITGISTDQVMSEVIPFLQSLLDARKK
jgi:ADP-heptose:LPS heptosyltransferase